MELEESAEVLENAWWAKRADRDEDGGPLAEGPKFPPGRNTIH